MSYFFIIIFFHIETINLVGISTTFPAGNEINILEKMATKRIFSTLPSVDEDFTNNVGS